MLGKKTKYVTVPPSAQTSRQFGVIAPPKNEGGAFCPSCGAAADVSYWHKWRVCSSCGYHDPVPASERIGLVFDPGSFAEMGEGIESWNPLAFPGYGDKLAAVQKQTGLKEAIITGTGEIEGIPVVAGIMDSRFLMGSMGAATGEKIVKAAKRALEERKPLIIFAASGGARMQEGMAALMQMARTSQAVERLHEEGILYISVLTHPTTGGVIASFASLADIILAEPGALIGFTGPRVYEQTTGIKLPDGFQRAEFLLEHGMIDKIVARQSLRQMLAWLLAFHGYGGKHGDKESGI